MAYNLTYTATIIYKFKIDKKSNKTDTIKQYRIHRAKPQKSLHKKASRCLPEGLYILAIDTAYSSLTQILRKLSGSLLSP